MSFEQLLQFEEKSKFLFSTKVCKDEVLLWPFIRYLVHQEALNVMNGFSNPHAKSGARIGFLPFLKYITLTLLKNPFFARKCPVVIFGSNVVNTREGEIYVSRLYDPLIEKFPKECVLLEYSYHGSYRRPRALSVWYADLIIILIRFLSRFETVRRADLETIEKFIDKISREYPINLGNDFYRFLKNRLMLAVKRWRPYGMVLSIWTRFSKAKAVIIEDASYGGDHALEVYRFRKAGIKVVEIQHGLVSEIHPAYNYSKETITNKNDYHMYLPEYYLTFGSFWADCVRLPSSVRTLGFPFLRKRASANRILNTGIVLVVSDGSLPSLVTSICTSLLEAFRGKYSIILKLHPGEVPLLRERYETLNGVEGVEIRTYESIYDLLSKSEHVIGFMSTVMVEALAYGIKPFVLDNEYSRQLFGKIDFNYFQNADDLIIKIQGNKTYGPVDVNRYWSDFCPETVSSLFIESGVSR